MSDLNIRHKIMKDGLLTHQDTRTAFQSYDDSKVKYIVIRGNDSGSRDTSWCEGGDCDNYNDVAPASGHKSLAKQYAKIGALSAAIWGVIESVNAGITLSLIKSPKFHKFISKGQGARTLTAFALPAALIAGVSAVMGAVGYIADRFNERH